MDESNGTEVTPDPDEAGHEDVSGGETTPPSGAPEEAEEESSSEES